MWATWMAHAKNYVIIKVGPYGPAFFIRKGPVMKKLQRDIPSLKEES